MSNLLKEQFLKLKIESKTKGVSVNFDEISSVDKFLDDLAYTIVNDGCGIILIKKSYNLPDKEFLKNAEKVKILAQQFDTTIMIESRADIAFILDADAIILSDSDLEFEKIKEILPENILVGELVKDLASYDETSDFLLISQEYVQDQFPLLNKSVLLLSDKYDTKSKSLQIYPIAHLAN